MFQRAVVAQAKDEPITEEMVKQAEWISGLKLKPEDRKRLVRSLQGLQAGYAELRKIPLPNSVPPASPMVPLIAETRLPVATRKPASTTSCGNQLSK